MKINMTEWAKAVIDSKKVMAVPIMTHPGIEMIGRRVIDAVSDGEVHFNAVRALAGRYDTAAARLLDKCTHFILKYCIALKKTGANGVVMAEPAAGLMSDDDCMRFSSV
ncbi:MAG: hypothetical protein U0M48_01230, partial [Xylanibacter rarus]